MAELVREVVIGASPATIYPFLTDPTQHVLWMGTEAELEPHPGGRYRVLAQAFIPGRANFWRWCPTRRWSSPSGGMSPTTRFPPASTEVEITLIPEGEKTRVRLVHRGLPDDAVADHSEGWDFYLNRLAVVATGGDAGPETSHG